MHIYAHVLVNVVITFLRISILHLYYKISQEEMDYVENNCAYFIIKKHAVLIFLKQESF